MTSPGVDRPSESWWWKRHFYASGGIVLALLLYVVWTSIFPVTPLSDEGTRLLSRTALLVVVLLVTAFARTMVGRSPRRNFRMALGTIGGMAAGLAAAGPLSQLVGADVSTLSALVGVFLGWAVAYQFVKHLPRGAAWIAERPSGGARRPSWEP